MVLHNNTYDIATCHETTVLYSLYLTVLIWFSLSVSTALAMTYAGAKGTTASQMCQVLGFSPLTFNVHAIFSATLNSMNANQGDYTLALANGLFIDTGFSVRPSFPSLLANYYSASFKLLNFRGDPAGSADYINQWVEDKTNKKIKDIVSEDDLHSAEFALANAIYFKGSWKCPFDPLDTRIAPFHISPTHATGAYMMIQTARFRYALNHWLCCEILELPYEGDRLAMYILLPTDRYGLAALESKLTFQSLTSALARLRRRRLSVAIPRFEMTVGERLPEVLKKMGMKLAFTSSADFDGIGSGVYISKVIHKAFIGVDEKGTEAAAATIVIGVRGRPPPPLNQDFIADHPFLFLIRDNKTGSILFLGRLVNPK